MSSTNLAPNPLAKHVMTKKELLALIDSCNNDYWYNGQIFEIKNKRIAPDRYEVTFKRTGGYHNHNNKP